MKVCTIEGCEKGGKITRGFCQMHYLRVKKYGDPNANPRYYAPPICEIEGCDAASARGRYCTTHRARMERYGVPDLPPRANRHSNDRGYQLIRVPGHPVARVDSWAYEHRVVLFDAIGPGAHACHWCRETVDWDLRHREDAGALVVDHLDENPQNNELSNLVPSCGPCNVARSSRWVKQKRVVNA